MRSDDELHEAWRAGEETAGHELYGRYFPLVYRFFSNKVGDEMEDLVQQTFMACVSHRDRLRDGTSFRAFVLVVARNQLFKHLRRRYRAGQPIDLAETSLADLGASPSVLVARRDEHRLVLAALRRITLDFQDIIELHYFEQLSGPELATVLDIPEGTVRSRLRRALEALRAELARLAQSPDQVESTISSLSQWAAEIRSLAQRGMDVR